MNRLSAMETFIRVIDAGWFSHGAKQLRVGPPRPSQFEDRRVLLRSTHGLMPAAAGRSFYERAKRSIGEADEAELAAQQLSRPPSRVGVNAARPSCRLGSGLHLSNDGLTFVCVTNSSVGLRITVGSAKRSMTADLLPPPIRRRALRRAAQKWLEN
ncbi:hypothetical protein SAMN05443247_09704 [Bradyrhizobium erythrophlei]|nr:hypothetical protein SAMN05443247_09704 [Bradyrhizobium erythrophlei]